MSQDTHNENKMDDSGVTNKTQSRRKFLLKASTGALVASIPAKSVWATGLSTNSSLTASGHGSDFAQNQSLTIQNAHYFLNFYSHASEMSDNYSLVTGGKVVKINHSKTRFINHQFGLIEIRHLLGDEDAIKHLVETTLSHKEGRVYTTSSGTKKVKYRDSSTSAWQRTNFSNVVNMLKGTNNINEYIACAYMSAIKTSLDHNADIFYPVLRTPHNPAGKVDGKAALLRILHDSASSQHTQTLHTLQAMMH